MEKRHNSVMTQISWPCLSPWYWRHWQSILKLQARTLISRKARTKDSVAIPGPTRKVPELISLTRSMSSKNGQADVCIIPRTEGNTQASQGNVCIIPRTEGNTQANQGSWDLWRGAWTKEEPCLSPQHNSEDEIDNFLESFRPNLGLSWGSSSNSRHFDLENELKAQCKDGWWWQGKCQPWLTDGGNLKVKSTVID